MPNARVQVGPYSQQRFGFQLLHIENEAYQNVCVISIDELFEALHLLEHAKDREGLLVE